MTNGEKYKTAQERAEAFSKFCKSNITDDGMCMPDCKLFYAKDDEKSVCGHCEFYWLDLEAEEEKPLPCPFCKHPQLRVYANENKKRVYCPVCGFAMPWRDLKEDAYAEYNRVATKCWEVK